jgi:hypothetical protein
MGASGSRNAGFAGAVCGKFDISPTFGALQNRLVPAIRMGTSGSRNAGCAGAPCRLCCEQDGENAQKMEEKMRGIMEKVRQKNGGENRTLPTLLRT